MNWCADPAILTLRPKTSPWRVIAAKTEGVTPGFTIKDAKGRTYQIKFDTLDNFEQGTGADVMGSKFFYALGYNTPENYIVYFRPEQLLVDEKTEFVDYRGVERHDAPVRRRGRSSTVCPAIRRADFVRSQVCS